jgi:DNA-binding NarL/FixJ family response regulator
MSIRLVIADGHPFILNALENLFHHEQNIEILARCRNGEEALQAVRQHQPDILVLDIRMPQKDGLAVLYEMRLEQLSTRVVILTAELDERETLRALRLGVSGIVLKNAPPQLLVQCIRKVHAGGQWLERHSSGRVLDQLLRREAGVRELARVLTSREREILQLVAGGLSNKAVAKELSLSEGTVKTHLHNIYKKLGIHDRVALLLYIQDKRLI